MNLKRAIISVCMGIFSVVLAVSQSLAAERLAQSPDTTVLEKGIKQKLESASPEAKPPSPSKAFSSRSYFKVESTRPFRHRAHPQPKSPSNLAALSSQSHIKSKSAGSFKHRAPRVSKYPANSKALLSGSNSGGHQRYRSHGHRSSWAGGQPLEVPIIVVIVPVQEVPTPLIFVPIVPHW
jgi:hypothetical protein